MMVSKSVERCIREQKHTPFLLAKAGTESRHAITAAAAAAVATTTAVTTAATVATRATAAEAVGAAVGVSITATGEVFVSRLLFTRCVLVSEACVVRVLLVCADTGMG